MLVNKLRIYTFIVVMSVLLFSCKKSRTSQGRPKSLTVFHAPCFSPVIDDLNDNPDFELRTEVNGSQVVCRKVTELGRECDIMMLADNGLFKKMASSHCSWRIDFLHDEIVLAVGLRAKKVDDAENDWIPVLLNEDLTIGRVDENLGPVGYRSLMVWKLSESEKYPDLLNNLKLRCDKIAEHAGQLAALLSTGDVDYGFLYKSTCIKHDIRFIPLEKSVNLASGEVDYSGAEITVEKAGGGENKSFTVSGSPITYSISIPSNVKDRDAAKKFILLFLSKDKEKFSKYGFEYFRPKFYGNKDDYKPFNNIAEYAGAF
jgi:molybdate/tungstate transport system substrate-binding protein